MYIAVKARRGASGQHWGSALYGSVRRLYNTDRPARPGVLLTASGRKF